MQIIDLTTLARYDHDLKEWLPIRRVLHQNPYDDPNDGWEIGVELVVGGVASGNNIPIKIMPDGGIFIWGLGGYNGDSDVGGCVDLVTVINSLFGKIPTTRPSNPSAGSYYFTSSGMYGYLHIYNGSDWFSIQLEIEAQEEGGGEIANP